MSWDDNIKNWNGKLYKVLSNGKSCHGGKFKWSLPEDDKPGEWTPAIDDVEICKKGYHLTTHYAHWSDRDNVEVYEAEGDVVKFDGYDKVVCSRARLLKRVENPFSGDENSGHRNSGNYNSGYMNSGNYNSGHSNSGNNNSGMENSGMENSGDNNFGGRNSGDYNSGDRNSGHYNSGDRNSGNYNSGNRNSGYRNSGDGNSGDRNSGNYNSGHHNSGHYNSGNYNSGCWNSGRWNSGDNSSGYLCVQTPPIYLFDKPAPKGWNCSFPDWMYFKLLPEGYKASWQEAFKNASIEGVKELINLPNFDFKVFEEISSIAEEQIRDKLGDF
jgi:hypothetical protein